MQLSRAEDGVVRQRDRHCTNQVVVKRLAIWASQDQEQCDMPRKQINWYHHHLWLMVLS
jgi:hypothetical protein